MSDHYPKEVLELASELTQHRYDTNPLISAEDVGANSPWNAYVLPVAQALIGLRERVEELESKLANALAVADQATSDNAELRGRLLDMEERIVVVNNTMDGRADDAILNKVAAKKSSGLSADDVVKIIQAVNR